LPLLGGAHLSKFLYGMTAAQSKTLQVKQANKTGDNPVYDVWYAQDQQLLSFLLNSVTKEVFGHITIKASAGGAWRVITGMFASQSRARIAHLRSKLASTRKGDLTCTTYFTQMKGFADEMAAAGKHLDDEEVICYILVGLDVDFNSFIEAFTTK
jgi:hypothetical protein